MAALLTAPKPGTPLALAGGLPPIRNAITAASAGAPQKESDANQYRDMARLGNLSPSLAAILRPQAAYRWLLPYVAALTPQYIESVLRGALAGNHVQAWELFDLMMDTDPEIAACTQEYVEGIQRKKVKFIPYADEGEEPSDTALEKCKLVSAAFRNMRPEAKYDESGFGEMVKDIIAARWHGQSIIEMDWMDTYKDGNPFLRDIPGFNNPVLCPRASFWVHPVCYAWDMSGRLGLRVAVESQLASMKKAAGYSMANKDYSLVEPPVWNWIASQPRPSALMDFPANKFLISIFKAKTGSALSGSCLRPLAWWWIASNFCGDWLMNYAQVFGIPLRVASMAPGTSQATWDDVRAIMRAAGSAPYLVLPQGADIKVVEKGGQAGESPQAFLFHFADDQKRKVILHQTMTGGSHSGGSSGTGQSFGATEQDTKQCCIDAGASHVETILNLQAIPYILNLNYGEGGDLEAPTVSLVDAKVGGLADAQRDQILVQVMDIGENYMHEKYGIPKPSDDEELAGQDIGANANTAKLQQQQQSAQNEHDETMAELNAPEPGDEPEEGAGSSQPPKGEPTQAKSALAAGAPVGNRNAAKDKTAIEQNIESRKHIWGTPLKKYLEKEGATTGVEKATASYLHRGWVTRAVEHDYPVPKEVLKDYPPEVLRDFTKLKSKRAIQAAAAPADPDTKSADSALLESIQPMLDRLEAIKAVKDSSTRRRLLSKFLRDHESITAAILHDQALSRAVTPDVVSKFVAGLKSKGAKP